MLLLKTEHLVIASLERNRSLLGATACMKLNWSFPKAADL
jgi:hypothetical protein